MCGIGVRFVNATLVVVALTLLAGCAGGPTLSPTPNHTPEPSPGSSTLRHDSTGDCHTDVTMTVDGPELKGTASDDTSLYGLVMAGQWPLRANASVVKVVWRMTGVGELRISIEDPSGATRELAWGPELHGGSSYDRPGQEWGTGFVVDEPGCWHLNFTRSGHGSAEAWIDVLP